MSSTTAMGITGVRRRSAIVRFSGVMIGVFGFVAAPDGTELWRPPSSAPDDMVTSVDPGTIRIDGTERRAEWRMDALAGDAPASLGRSLEHARRVVTVLISVRVRCSDRTLAEGDTTMAFADGSRRTFPKRQNAEHWYRGTGPADAVVSFVCGWKAP
jgi:hypothetical protein